MYRMKELNPITINVSIQQIKPQLEPMYQDVLSN